MFHERCIVLFNVEEAASHGETKVTVLFRKLNLNLTYLRPVRYRKQLSCSGKQRGRGVSLVVSPGDLFIHDNVNQ